MGKRQQTVQFQDVAVGECFEFCGRAYRKLTNHRATFQDNRRNAEAVGWSVRSAWFLPETWVGVG